VKRLTRAPNYFSAFLSRSSFFCEASYTPSIYGWLTVRQLPRSKKIPLRRPPRLEKLLLNDLKKEIAAARGPQEIVDWSMSNMLDSVGSLVESLLHYRKPVEKSRFLRQITSIARNGDYDLLRKCMVERSWGIFEKTASLKENIMVFRKSKTHIAYGAYVQINLKSGPEIPEGGGIMLLGRLVHVGTGPVKSDYERIKFKSFHQEIAPRLSDIWRLQKPS